MNTNVFGLDVALPGPVEGCPPRERTGRRPPLHVVDVDGADLAAAWDAAGAQRLVREPPSGPAHLTVDAQGTDYLVAWSGIGRFLLTGDSRVLCTREAAAGPGWDRCLTAQILPLAAVMAGIEVLHASAVVLDGEALGIVGASGAGKSATARALVDRGARLLTDDVLALTREDGRLLAHPGPDRLRTGPRADKQAEAVPAAAGPAPLGGLFFVDRTAAAQDIGPVGFRELAGATFNLLVRTPERLERHLDLAATVAGQGMAVRAAFTPGASPGDVADALLAWRRSRG